MWIVVLHWSIPHWSRSSRFSVSSCYFSIRGNSHSQLMGSCSITSILPMTLKQILCVVYYYTGSRRSTFLLVFNFVKNTNIACAQTNFCTKRMIDTEQTHKWCIDYSFTVVSSSHINEREDKGLIIENLEVARHTENSKKRLERTKRERKSETNLERCCTGGMMG